MAGHFIVCGDDALGIRIVDELTNAGARVASVQSPTAWPPPVWPTRRR